MRALRSAELGSIFAVVTALVALGTSGCFFQFGDERQSAPTPASTSRTPETPPPPSTTPTPNALRVAIDPGATIPMTPGQQVGLYVEYASGGHWKVSATCDTKVSNASCSFDLNVTPEPGSKVSGVAAQNLTTGDAMTQLDDGTVQLVSTTRFEPTSISFDTEPGALIEINMLLDGKPRTDIVNWTSGGKAQAGVPSNPVDFTPSKP